MKPNGRGSYVKLLELFDMDLSTPYNIREKTLDNLINQLKKIDDDLGWWDEFLESANLKDRLESSCMFTDAMEDAESRGYSNGYDAGIEENVDDVLNKFVKWRNKLFTFLKDRWVGLNKEQIVEVEDWFDAYPMPEE